MKLAFFVLADLFVPLMLSTGACLKKHHGHTACYLNFLPSDHKLLSKNTDQYFPKHLASLDGCKDGVEIMFSESEVEGMVNFMQLKHGGSLQEWHARVNAVARYVHRFMQAEQPDAFVLWNGQDHIGQVISVLCRAKNIPVVYMENGYFSNTLQADPQGVNAAASLAQLNYEEIMSLAQAVPTSAAGHDSAPEFAFQPLSRSESALIALAHRTNKNYYSTYPEQRGTSRLKSWRIKRYRNTIPNDAAQLPEHFAFVPFQVHDDTQVLLNSRLVHSVEEFFKTVHAAIRRTCGPDYPIIVKEHPEDLGRYDYEPLRKQFPDVIWFRKFDIETLLDRADMVCVINSSVGLQAVRRKKPTVVLGESFYSKPEIAFVVKHLDELDTMVAKAAQGVDAQMAEHIDQFIDALNQTLFVKGTWKHPACVQAAPAVALRLTELFGKSEQKLPSLAA
ncbi:capsular biosynthesis protein [Herbaspirillum lusitanum]|jgi:capsule polysaccharide modification protein KpsS|uniref:Capsular biosynthesis protein n=1 Tax=Herbaspirillum lusitanum TaxID=213312 RepID=A0ABW9A6P5_9BURK